jgi:hypothetical protein
MSTTTTERYETKDAALEALRSGDATQRVAVTAQAKAEHKALKEAKAAKAEAPETPALDALNEETANGTRKRTAKERVNGGASGKAVNLTDDQLRDEIVPELFAAGHRTVGAMVKALRGTERGTNPKRMKRAFDAAVEAGKIDLSTEAPAPAKATKAPAKKAAASKTEVTPRPKRSSTKSPSQMGAEDEVAKRRSTRARKAS